MATRLELMAQKPTSTPSLTDLVGQLTGDVRELAQAEVALVKARVSDATGRYSKAAMFFGAAGAVALAALIALLVGLIMTLATLVGPGWATLIVVAASLAIAGVLAMIGKARLAGTQS